ncbi:phage terminase, large subunit, PBSX family [Serratia entomophila]|uniref:PBSX family phage terminase large subunit n=1 Tax=Serratia entomophila TaxID=42906 RepID=UPI002177989E|nr:PBSX family phage terminase large subunit [Serratia entomophila]CAI0848726.1 phage terminase, large subunit, PBSX family [Serratia entomophila]CAI1545010.1 phage terminase, large subunit, PBSX family [Serratia entomophila]CAI1562441.1 phage terminase, large subunit, PBSX family [Serratia entomophila]CAI1597760.1 phage terminase, large subunit, PBSX family [Serratia entomophila]CAI1675005.1 phage terminase, large subunit, PBSX family [Serratia entomophila]
MRWRWTYGGRGGGKSVEIARALVILGAIDPMIILCAREFQNSISDSVLALLEAEIYALGLNHFYTVKNNEITGRNGTRFTFKGLRTNLQSIKSMFGIKICWVEEAQTVSQDSWDTLGPTVRANNSEVWVSYNPREATDPTYTLMKRHEVDPPDGGVIIRQVNYPDNAFFPDVLRQEMEYCKRVDYEAAQKAIDDGTETRQYFPVKGAAGSDYWTERYENFNGVATPTGEKLLNDKGVDALININTEITNSVGQNYFDFISEGELKSTYAIPLRGDNAPDPNIVDALYWGALDVCVPISARTASVAVEKTGVGVVNIFGTRASLASGRGFSILNMGQGGAQASNYGKLIPNLANVAPVIDVDSVIIMLGTNDVRENATPSAYAQNLTALVTAWKNAVGPSVGINIMFAEEVNRNLPAYPDYELAARGVAESQSVGYIDLFHLFPDRATTSALNMFADIDHLNTSGATHLMNFTLNDLLEI